MGTAPLDLPSLCFRLVVAHGQMHHTDDKPRLKVKLDGVLGNRWDSQMGQGAKFRAQEISGNQKFGEILNSRIKLPSKFCFMEECSTYIRDVSEKWDMQSQHMTEFNFDMTKIMPAAKSDSIIIYIIYIYINIHYSILVDKVEWLLIGIDSRFPSTISPRKQHTSTSTYRSRFNVR